MGSRLILNESILEFGGSKFTTEDLITENFLKKIESRVSDYNNNCFEVNELYVSYLQRYLAVELFIKDNLIDEIDIQNGEKQLTAFLIDIATRNNIAINAKTKRHIGITLKTFLTLWASIIYLYFKMLKKRKIDKFPDAKIYTIIRDKASEAKLKKINVVKFYDDILWDNNEDSIYKYISCWEKTKWFFKCFFITYKSMHNLKKVVREYMGEESKIVVMNHYEKRMASTGIYYCLVESLFSNHKPDTYFTGINLERYALVEDVLAKKYDVKTVCIPHGLEFGFKFPYGFTSDVFYTTSDYAAEYFNKMYETNKFVFDTDIATKMFKRDYQVPANHVMKIIFFTESRDIYVNQEIIRQMIVQLKGSGKELYVKLHPADKKENYKEFDLNYVENFDESICDNICVARKSTVLLEATYNESLSAAILINNKDKAMFYTFPSLQSDMIKKFTMVKDLVDWIKSN